MYLDEVIAPAMLRDLLSHPVTFERIGVVLCDETGAEIGATLLAEGSERSVEIDLNDLRRAVDRLGARGMILMHSHPNSVTPVPSREDVEMTSDVHELFAEIGVKVLDHHIYGMHGAKVFKFSKAGVRWQ
jgi:DNA repair protein RadC